MALAAYLPETSQAPLGWVYLAIGTVVALLLGISLPGTKDMCRILEVSESSLSALVASVRRSRLHLTKSRCGRASKSSRDLAS